MSEESNNDSSRPDLGEFEQFKQRFSAKLDEAHLAFRQKLMSAIEQEFSTDLNFSYLFRFTMQVSVPAEPKIPPLVIHRTFRQDLITTEQNEFNSRN